MSRTKHSPSKELQQQLKEKEARVLRRTNQVRSGGSFGGARQPTTPTEQRRARLHKLSSVFKVFDLDKSGAIESIELLQLGKMRRQLGQKCGDWNEAKNAKLVKKMDANADGTVSDPEFSDFFEKSLSKIPEEFEVIVEQFFQVAQVCRQRKREAKLARQRAMERPRPQQNNHTSGAASAGLHAEVLEAVPTPKRSLRFAAEPEVFVVADYILVLSPLSVRVHD